MSFPSKFTSFDNSILSKITLLINDNIKSIKITELFDFYMDRFSDVSEFILALEVLHVLGKIELDEKEGVIRYVN